MAENPQIIIIGAGFGGIQAAKMLADTAAQVTIIDKNNHHLFQPLLYQVATAGLAEDDIACPVRSLFRNNQNIDFRMDEVIAVDLDEKVVITSHIRLAYDFLLVATGSMTNYFGNESLSRNAFGLKTLYEAVAIRNHIIQMFELASHEENSDRRHALLTFVVVGGGPTGVESAGALSELIFFVLGKEYHTINFKEVRIILLEAADSVLQNMPPRLREATVETLIRKHVEVRLLIQVKDFDGQRLILQGGEIIPTHTVIWAAGVCAVHPLAANQVQQDGKRRVLTNEYLQLPGYPEVFVIGDMAHSTQDRPPLPMIAPVAIQQACTAVENIGALRQLRPLKIFVYKPVGDLATIGRNAAVVHIGNFQAQGFVAWIIWSAIHILRIIHFRNRTVIVLKWIWEYLTYDRVEHVISQREACLLVAEEQPRS